MMMGEERGLFTCVGVERGKGLSGSWLVGLAWDGGGFWMYNIGFILVLLHVKASKLEFRNLGWILMGTPCGSRWVQVRNHTCQVNQSGLFYLCQ